MTAKIRLHFIITSLCLGFIQPASTQATKRDSVKLDYSVLFSHCLNADVIPALKLLEVSDENILNAADINFKNKFYDRFRYQTDNSNYIVDKKSDIDSLLLVFHKYWRQSLLDISNNYDSTLISNLKVFITSNFPETKGIDIKDDSIDGYIKRYIENKGFHTTNGVGKTGRLFDLLVWKTEKDTIYSFKLNKEKISARVILMNNFITLGWEEYATLGRYYPGGWTTDEALYCVEKAYDLTSEDFLISYLAHEGRHFSDYKLFPNLKNSVDLEYRAKLTELSMAKKTMYKLIDFFIANANYNSKNGHSVANYFVIRDLSRKFFDVEFEKDLSMWKKIDESKINKVAYNILCTNTKAMQTIGSDIEEYIK